MSSCRRRRPLLLCFAFLNISFSRRWPCRTQTSGGKGAKPDSLNAAHKAGGSERGTAGLEAAAAATGRQGGRAQSRGVALRVFAILEKPSLGEQRRLQSGPLSAPKAFEGQDRTASSRPAGQPRLPATTRSPTLPGFVLSGLFQAHRTLSPLTGLARFFIPSRTVTTAADTGRGFFPEQDFRHRCARTDLHLSGRVHFDFQWEEGANRYL